MSGPAVRRRAAALGVAGEVLITAGVLLALFVVWQLWWTDVTGARAQAALVDELGWEPAVPVDLSPAAPVARTDPAPVIDRPPHGTTFATMAVPRGGGIPMPITEGTTKRDVLDTRGVGHYEGTAMPGAVGNFAVAGRRVTYGRPFHRVEELVPDAPGVVRTEETWYVYRVVSTQVVRPAAVEVIAPVPGDPDSPATEALMTMTTCHPMYSARERFVVHLALDYWLPVAAGTPRELLDTASAPGVA